MSTLISHGRKDPRSEGIRPLIEFVQLKQNHEPEVRRRQLPKKAPEPKRPPRQPKLNLAKKTEPPNAMDQVSMPALSLGPEGIGNHAFLAGSGSGFNRQDAEEVPLVRINPQYPRRARVKGIEGIVLVQFIVTKSGAVREVEIVEANPPGIFNRDVRKAVLRWKYKPKLVNGKAVERTLLEEFVFKLE